MSHDIYESPKRLEYVLKKIREDDKITDKNKELLFKFHQFCIAEGLGLSRVIRCLYALRSFAEWTRKGFDECKKDDIVMLISELEKSKYMHSTKQEMKITLRKFFKWMKNTEDYPEEVRWLKCHRTLSNNKLPEDLLTEDDVKLLINTADKKRDRALIAVLYESGVRIGELLSLRMKHISFEKHGAHLLVNGKTGMRRIMIIASVPYLKDWIDEHPTKDNPDVPLWILEKKVKELNHKNVQRILRKIKEKSGIKKKTNAHNFRHSRATYLADYLTDAQMKEYLGWVQSSKMASVYIHMSGKNVDNALLKLYGIDNKTEDIEKSKFISKKCERCGGMNSPTDKFCKCGMVLDNENMIEILKNDIHRKKADEILDKLIQNPEFREIFLSKIKEVIK